MMRTSRSAKRNKRRAESKMQAWTNVKTKEIADIEAGATTTSTTETTAITTATTQLYHGIVCVTLRL